MGRARRRLAGTGPGLHRCRVQGHPRPADSHPAPPLPGRRAGLRPGLPAGRLPRSARQAVTPLPHPSRRVLDRREPTSLTPATWAPWPRAAEDRGLLRDAARLRKRAAAHGSASAAAALITSLRSLHPADDRPRHVGRRARRPRRPVRRRHGCCDALRQAGAADQVGRSAARDPPRTPPSTTRTPPPLLTRCAMRAQPTRSATCWPVTRPRTLPRQPARTPPACCTRCGQGGRSRPGSAAGATRRCACPLDDPYALPAADALLEAGATDQVASAARDPAAHAPVDDLYATGRAAARAARGGRADQVQALAARPPRMPPSTTRRHRPAAGDAAGGARAPTRSRPLADRAARTPPSTTRTPPCCCWTPLRTAGAADQVEALLARSAAHAPSTTRPTPSRLLDVLRQSGAADQVAALSPATRPRTPPRLPCLHRLAAGRAADSGRRRPGHRPAARDPPRTPSSTTQPPPPCCWSALRSSGRADQVSRSVLRCRHPPRNPTPLPAAVRAAAAGAPTRFRPCCPRRRHLPCTDAIARCCRCAPRAPRPG